MIEHIYLALCVFKAKCDVLRTLYQVTLVIVKCVDENNETFANGDSVRPLKGLRCGLTDDIKSEQVGR